MAVLWFEFISDF